MRITSKIDGTDWLWVNIPKTASSVLYNAFEPTKPIASQTHHSYGELRNIHGSLPTFTVVRNPVDRFRSGLNHLFSVCVCGGCIVNKYSPPHTINLIYFLKDLITFGFEDKSFYERVYHNNQNLLYKKILDSIQKNFRQSIVIGNEECVRWPFAVSQSFLLGDIPNHTKIFKYENIKECFSFVEEELGYKVSNSRLRDYPNNLSIDFSDSTVVSLIKQLYMMDYTLLNY
jgi:hypothetical protein